MYISSNRGPGLYVLRNILDPASIQGTASISHYIRFCTQMCMFNQSKKNTCMADQSGSVLWSHDLHQGHGEPGARSSELLPSEGLHPAPECPAEHG